MIIEELMHLTFVLIIAIVAHESAHWLTLRMYIGRKPKIRKVKNDIIIGTKKDYQPLTNIQYIFVMTNGIISGLLFLFLLLSGWQLILALMYYLPFGCRADFINIFKGKK